MANKIIFSMSRVSKIHPPKKQVLKNISLSFFYGAKIGVLGLNGSGKSSLLRIIAGLDQDYHGEVSFSKGYSVGFLEQEPKLDDGKTVREVVEQGLGKIVSLLKEFEEINASFEQELSQEQMDALLERQAKLQDALDASNAWELDSKIDQALDSLCCPPGETPIKNLSGGERRRVALCRLLLEEPDVLLLDEPTNHLDASTVFWLEQHLSQYKGTVIAVTHDRYFLDHVAGWILELDRGEGIPWEGNYSSWLEQKHKRLAQEEKTESKRQKALAKELEWIRSSPKARMAKSKARISNYESMMQVQKEKRHETTELFIPTGPRLGQMVIEAQGISKSFNGKTLYENLSFKLPPGGVIGIIGPNGVGKSTLFKMMTGEVKPDQGSLKIGETVKLSYVDQGRGLDLEKNMLQIMDPTGGETVEIGGKEINIRAYLSQFNFNGDDHYKIVKNLSGGERNRLHLAKTLLSEGNVLLLDEPTNDLDVNTLRALEDALVDFPGCAVIIGHDRYFLDRLCTHILSFDKLQQPIWYEGSYSDYENYCREVLGFDVVKMQRGSYKKLQR